MQVIKSLTEVIRLEEAAAASNATPPLRSTDPPRRVLDNLAFCLIPSVVHAAVSVCSTGACLSSFQNDGHRHTRSAFAADPESAEQFSRQAIDLLEDVFTVMNDEVLVVASALVFPTEDMAALALVAPSTLASSAVLTWLSTKLAGLQQSCFSAECIDLASSSAVSLAFRIVELCCGAYPLCWLPDPPTLHSGAQDVVPVGNTIKTVLHTFVLQFFSTVLSRARAGLESATVAQELVPVVASGLPLLHRLCRSSCGALAVEVVATLFSLFGEIQGNPDSMCDQWTDVDSHSFLIPTHVALTSAHTLSKPVMFCHMRMMSALCERMGMLSHECLLHLCTTIATNVTNYEPGFEAARPLPYRLLVYAAHFAACVFWCSCAPSVAWLWEPLSGTCTT